MTLTGYKISRFILFFTISILLSSCGQGKERPPILKLSGVTMGTTYDIKINSRIPEQMRDRIKADVAVILDNIDRKMSTYKPDSELSIININKTGSWLPVSEDLYKVLRDSIYISEVTGGAFDITVGHLVNLWGFGPEQKTETIPADKDILNILAITGYKNLELKPEPRSLAKKHPGIYIDLSGIAKGYAVDRIAEYLGNSGYTDFLVEIGGEIRATGVNAKRQPWNIGIEKPIAGGRSVQRAVALRNMAMATSGDYRNYFEIDGIRYSHTIDPRTGRPVAHDLVSVTVLNPSATIADALATGLLVLGPESANELAENLGITAYLIIRTREGYTELMTPGFTAYLNNEHATDR